jgi:signal transduction histidine kinase
MFFRLTLILVVVTFLAQLVSAALHFQDRGQVLFHTAGLNSAERIAGIVRLLDPMIPKERERAVAALDVPALRLALDQAASWPQENSTSHPDQTKLLQQLLRSYLGDARPIQVMIRQTPLLIPQSAYGMPLYPFDRRADQSIQPKSPTETVNLVRPQGVSFLARIRLDDRSWVLFDHRVPEEVFGWSRKLLWSLIVLLLSTVAVALVAVHWITRPLADLSHAAEALGRDIRSPPLVEKGSIEVRRAARAFNTMQAHLVRFLQDRSRIMAAISHDLKTPVTRLRLRTEMLENDEIRAKFVSDLDEMETMVQGALDFMRGMDSEEPRQAIDINALLESLQADAEDTGHHVEVSGVAASPYVGRPLLLKRCLSNLLDNAVKYGGKARVQVEDTHDVLRFRIADEGPGILEDELEQVFEPFFRLEVSRCRNTGGTGLGLSIARNIARAHGGELRLRNRAEASGLEAIVSLPR